MFEDVDGCLDGKDLAPLVISPAEVSSSSSQALEAVVDIRPDDGMHNQNVYERRLRRSCRLGRQCISPSQVENLFKNSALSFDQKALYYYYVLLTDAHRVRIDEVLLKYDIGGIRVSLDREVLSESMVDGGHVSSQVISAASVFIMSQQSNIKDDLQRVHIFPLCFAVKVSRF